MVQIAQAEGLAIVPCESEADVLHRLADRAFGAHLSYPGEMVRQSSLAYYLKTPRLLIQMLRWFHPELLQGAGPLRILYLGANEHEILDEGRWFYAAFRLEGLPVRKLEITAVGPDLDQEDEADPVLSEEFLPRSMPTALVAAAPCTLEEAVELGLVNPDWESAYDLVVMHHPGFVGQLGDWLEDDAWNDLAGFGDIPIIGTSFDPVDLAFDRMGLATCGRIIDKAYWNTAAHLIPGIEHSEFQTRLFWGGVAWSTRLDQEIIEGRITPSQMDSIKRRSAVQKLLGPSMCPLSAALTWFWTCPMQVSDSGEAVWLSDEIQINVEDGRITAFGRHLDATKLSRRVVRTVKWKERMSLLGALTKELAVRLDVPGG